LTATASKSAAALEHRPSITTISANRFIHIRSNRFTPVLYWKQRGIPALRYCPKMGVASFRTCGPRHSCRAPHPRGLASFRTGSLRMREITHPLVPIRRCSPQKPQLSSYTVFTEG
jgi:hypothetical protein